MLANYVILPRRINTSYCVKKISNEEQVPCGLFNAKMGSCADIANSFSNKCMISQ